jgi:hypothetical protein
MQQVFVAKMEQKVKKRSVHAGPKHIKKCNRGRRAKLSSKHALEVASRRARVAELAASGQDLRTCEELLKQEGFVHADTSTLSRDLKRAREELNQATLLTAARHRDRLTKNLLALATVVRSRGLKHDDYVPDLLAIFNQLAKLLGLKCRHPGCRSRRQQRRHTTRETGGLAPVAFRETQFVPESAFDAIWAVCRKLSQPPTAARLS